MVFSNVPRPSPPPCDKASRVELPHVDSAKPLSGPNSVVIKLRGYIQRGRQPGAWPGQRGKAQI